MWPILQFLASKIDNKMGSLMRCQNGTGDDFLRSKVDTGRIPRLGRLTASHACLVSSTEILEV